VPNRVAVSQRGKDLMNPDHDAVPATASGS
jgi:hypothetical protein